MSECMISWIGSNQVFLLLFVICAGKILFIPPPPNQKDFDLGTPPCQEEIFLF